MSYIRLTEQRRYFPGESNLYVYPSSSGENNVIRFSGDLNGTVDAEDFFELIIRTLERTELNDDALWDAEAAVKKYHEQEQGKVEDLTETADND